MRQALVGFFRGRTFYAKAVVAGIVAVAISLAATGQSAANSKYAAIVIDANTGKTLFSANADSRRYPASLTKMMTLYLTFEALSRGKLTKETRVPFSARAAAESPTKLGVRAGGSISVESAIYGLVTKSANDAATALGELLGGSQEQFARMMTAKARSLGMNGTVFRNAHGLPDTGQFTTARDMATLGIALREHYPQYYGYFSTRSFTFGRTRMANHNRLLGRVKGVDGIKTGYTRASGFNLASSVSDGNRRIVAVVMGGTSGASRDNHMADLIKQYLPKASNRGKGEPLVARAGSTSFDVVDKVLLPKKDAPTPDQRPDAVVAEADDTVFVTEAPVQAYASPAPRPQMGIEQQIAPKAHIDPVNTASLNKSGEWVVQVASSPSRAEAQAFLETASKKAPGVLTSAAGFTVQFEKGGVTYHRARFGGFSTKSAAWGACAALKKQKITCYAVQN